MWYRWARGELIGCKDVDDEAFGNGEGGKTADVQGVGAEGVDRESAEVMVGEEMSMKENVAEDVVKRTDGNAPAGQ